MTAAGQAFGLARAAPDINSKSKLCVELLFMLHRMHEMQTIVTHIRGVVSVTHAPNDPGSASL